VEVLGGQFTQVLIPMVETVEVTQNQVPNTQCQLTNFPNPFNLETTIYFTTEHTENTELSIYNIRGQKVTTLINDRLEKGDHTVIWNGKDHNNKNVASGIYFYKLKAGEETKVKKMLLLK
ncbi:MAG: T9SS type A sorting domain-containing protein, partial [Candidatus Cloacimonetes bacterium]|nr:T9SS type A sorting domain-containing protein [Candidatus Cloacimonadota bacterium]